MTVDLSRHFAPFGVVGVAGRLAFDGYTTAFIWRYRVVLHL